MGWPNLVTGSHSLVTMVTIEYLSAKDCVVNRNSDVICVGCNNIKILHFTLWWIVSTFVDMVISNMAI